MCRCKDTDNLPEREGFAQGRFPGALRRLADARARGPEEVAREGERAARA